MSIEDHKFDDADLSIAVVNGRGISLTVNLMKHEDTNTSIYLTTRDIRAITEHFGLIDSST